MSCITTHIRDIFSNQAKAYFVILLILSFTDMVVGIVSLFVGCLAMQCVSLGCSVVTLIALIYGLITHLQDSKGKYGTLVISVIDVAMGILSVVLLTVSVAIIAGIATGATALKVSKTIVQSEKVKNFLTAIKPMVLKWLVKISPVFLIKYVIKIKKHIKENGRMNAFKNFCKKLCSAIKDNPVTICGSTLALGASGLGGTWLVKHILATGLLPEWASYVVGIAIVTIIYGLVEWAIVGAGAESEFGKTVRKVIKKSLKLVGANDMLADVEAIEKKAIEVDTENKIKAEAEAQLKLEQEKKLKEEEALRLEAQARLDAEAKEKAAKEQAERERLAKEAHDKKVAEMVEKLKAEQQAKK